MQERRFNASPCQESSQGLPRCGGAFFVKFASAGIILCGPKQPRGEVCQRKPQQSLGKARSLRTRSDDRRRLLCRHYGWGSPRDDDVDFEPGKLGRDLGQALAAPVCPAIFDRDRAALDPTEVVEPPRECGRPLTFRQRCAVAQEPDNWSLRRLLRSRRERPRRHRATEQRGELAPFHSMISSARVRRLSEILRPSAVAVFELITSSNLVG